MLIYLYELLQALSMVWMKYINIYLYVHRSFRKPLTIPVRFYDDETILCHRTVIGSQPSDLTGDS